MAELWMWIAYNNRWVALIGVIGAVLCLVGVIARWARSSVERDVTDHKDGEKS